MEIVYKLYRYDTVVVVKVVKGVLQVFLAADWSIDSRPSYSAKPIFEAERLQLKSGWLSPGSE